MTETLFAFESHPSAEEVAAFRGAVDRAVASGLADVVVELDQLGGLDSVVLAGLIAGLRRVREVGGSITLQTTRQDLRSTLSVTGLDQVFDVRTAPVVPVVHAPSRAQTATRRIVAAVLAGTIALASSLLPARAQQIGDLGPEAIISSVIARNPGMHSFQAHVDIRIHTGLPFLNPTLEGTTYFKRPDNFEVVLTKVPSYAKGFEKIYSDVGDPSSWDRRFTMTMAGETTFNGRKDLVIRLVQRVRGQIDHEDVAVDPTTWAIDRLTYYYYNGGTIALEQSFRDEGGFNVISDQRAFIALPHVPKATATAHYSDYHTNVAVDESVFTKHEGSK